MEADSVETLSSDLLMDTLDWSTDSGLSAAASSSSDLALQDKLISAHALPECVPIPILGNKQILCWEL